MGFIHKGTEKEIMLLFKTLSQGHKLISYKEHKGRKVFYLFFKLTAKGEKPEVYCIGIIRLYFINGYFTVLVELPDFNR